MKKPMKIAIAGHIQMFGDKVIEIDTPKNTTRYTVCQYPAFTVTQTGYKQPVTTKGNYKGFIPNNPKRRRK